MLRVHAHVTTTRAATEGNVHRTLVTGAFRSVPVVAHERSGATTLFASPENLPKLLDELRLTFEALPQHPFVRAAWISQAIGAIHPFIDGNGGTGRFLSSMELTRARLPPFVLTSLQRNTSYVDAMVDSDFGLPPLLDTVYDVVQHQLANVLAKDPPVAVWTNASQDLAATWIDHANKAWSRVAPPNIECREDVSALVAFVRRGYRIPCLPEPRVVQWASTTPIPLQFQLAVAPARAADAMWTLASVTATAGDDGALAPILVGEPLAAVFVAPPTEPPVVVNARFERWLEKRIDQSVRGLAAWM